MSKSYKNKKNKGSKKNNPSLGQTTPRSFSQQNSFKNVKIFVPKSQNSSTTESVQNLDQFGGLSHTSSPKISHDRSLSCTPRDKNNLVQENQNDEKVSISPLKLLTPKKIENELDSQKFDIEPPIEQILKENSPYQKHIDDPPQIVYEDLKVENRIEVIPKVYIEIEKENIQHIEEIKPKNLAEIEIVVHKEDLKDLKKSLPQQNIILQDKEKQNNLETFCVVTQETPQKSTMGSDPKLEDKNVVFKKVEKKAEYVPKEKGRDDCCAKCNIF